VRGLRAREAPDECRGQAYLLRAWSASALADSAHALHVPAPGAVQGIPCASRAFSLNYFG